MCLPIVIYCVFCVFVLRTSTQLVAEEGGRAVFLTVSRSNGLESAVSVEWEMQSNTAVASGEKQTQPPKCHLIDLTSSVVFFNSRAFFLAEGQLPVLGVYQSFENNPTSAWCSLPEGPPFLAVKLDRTPHVGSSHTSATLYRWQGVFVPVEVG